MEYIYNNNGYLGEIKRESDQLSIWGANTMNARGQIEQYTYGNGLVNHRGFSHGYVTGMQTEDVQAIFYIHTDHLGSIDVITDEDGEVYEEMSFDAWGRRRNPEDWTYSDIPEKLKFDRGYTGHEHLDYFGLIKIMAAYSIPWWPASSVPT